VRSISSKTIQRFQPVGGKEIKSDLFGLGLLDGKPETSMGYRHITVFLSRRDEDEFISFISNDEYAVVNPIVRPKESFMVLTKSPPNSNDDSSFCAETPGSLMIIHKKYSQHFTRIDTVGGYQFIEPQTSDAVFLNRTTFGKKIMFGSFAADANEDNTKWIGSLLSKISRWLTKNCFKLPDHGGFVGKDAMEFAAVEHKQLLGGNVYSIEKSSKGDYSVSYRLATRAD
jgi:hypothetical protein